MKPEDIEITYDEDMRALYITVSTNIVEKTLDFMDLHYMLDLDVAGNVVGIEVLL